MKTIHYSFLMCAALFLTEYVRAQTPVNWGSSTATVIVSGSLFTSQASSTAVTNPNGIEANQNGFIEFTLNQAVGNGVVGLGFTDATNTAPNINNSYVSAVFNGAMLQCFKPNNGWNACFSDWNPIYDVAGVTIKIERIGTVMNYYHNGILKTSQSVSTGIKLLPVIIFTDGTNGKSVNVSARISNPGVGTAAPAVEYTYDETGNRIRRRTVTVVLPRASKQEEEPITFSDFKLKVFPNPSDGRFEVTVEGDTEGLSFDVFDMAGKHVHKQPVAGLNTSVNVSHLSMGMYILTCRDAQKVKGQWKLLIQ